MRQSRCFLIYDGSEVCLDIRADAHAVSLKEADGKGDIVTPDFIHLQ